MLIVLCPRAERSKPRHGEQTHSQPKGVWLFPQPDHEGGRHPGVADPILLSGQPSNTGYEPPTKWRICNAGGTTLLNSSPRTELDCSNEEGRISGLAVVWAWQGQFPLKLVRYILLQDCTFHQVPNLKIFNPNLYYKSPIYISDPSSILESLGYSSPLGSSFRDCPKQVGSYLSHGIAI